MSFQIFNANPLIWIAADGVETDLTSVTGIFFTYLDVNGFIHEITILSSNFIIHTSTKITFNIPDNCDFNVSLITADITLQGTEFSGSVTLGPNTVIIANGSGIYKIVANKTNDTLYIDSSLGDVTADIKIPDPYFKTGYIGS